MSDQNQDLNIQDLQAKIEEIKQSLKQVEDMESRQQGLMDTALADARAQADQIIAEANANAEEIRERARAEGRKAVQADRDRVESERDALKSEVAALQAKKQEMLEQLGGMREQLQQTLNETQPVPAPVPTPVPTELPEVQPEPVPAPVEVPEVKPEPVPAPAEVPEVKPEPTPVPPVKAQPVPAKTTPQKAKRDTILVDAPGAKPKKKHRGLKVFLIILLILALAVAACFGFIFGIAKVNDEGMTEIAGKGDYVFYNRLAKEPENGDVIIIKDRKGAKRLRFVAATEGEQVDMDTMEKRLYVDDEVAVEDYEPMADDTTKYPHTVGNNEVYVLCDNRESASQEGLFSKSAIKGRVLLVFRR